MDISRPVQLETSFKILHFVMGETNFGVKLSEVTEIIKMMEVRKIPRVPAFIEGVLHLRGEIVIIINLKKLLLIAGKQNKPSKIIIFSIYGKKIGFIVDDVSKIIQKRNNDILPPPPVILKGPVTDCITGVFEENMKNVLMLDLTKSLGVLEEEGLNKVLERELSFLIDQINED